MKETTISLAEYKRLKAYEEYYLTLRNHLPVRLYLVIGERFYKISSKIKQIVFTIPFLIFFILVFCFAASVVALRQPVNSIKVDHNIEVNDSSIKLNAEVVKPIIQQAVLDQRIPVCSLSFQPNNSNKVEVPPAWLIARVSSYNCYEQKLLIRLSWYESTWNENAKNGYATGLYQIMRDTRKFCGANGKTSDEECALYSFEMNPHWFEAYTKNTNSFIF